ncbi:ATP-dependent nuclease [Proteus faecis]|uniref:ATP-dependent nuclease n=1 Tax=Proteus faecis TaxID=2050967 RepID=UPI000D68BE29|nr:AAA family ATPase [Proteus faecis]
MSKKIKAYIESITFSSGQELSLSEKDKILIVGPNNSGKSQTLREIISLLACENTEKFVIKEIKMKKLGTKADLINYMNENGEINGSYYHVGQASIYHSAVNSWEHSTFLDSFAPLFIKNITAKERLNICEQQNSISRKQQKSTPQHILYDDSDLMDEVSSIFKRAFNKDLIFDYRGGSKIPIHVADRAEFNGINDRVSNQFIDKLRSYPLLDQQGDGVKSYAGILFETIAFNLDIYLIDEPEAFLHPPQMRKLGRTLAEEVNGQLIVATHSSDIMRGFLEGSRGNIRIIRIQRDGDVNKLHEVDQPAIKTLWSQPNLKYSNALDSIFHEQVIICEDDSDCRLINFVADYISENNNEIFPDTSFVPAGGKHAISGIAKILRLAGVPVKAIYDFDLISERNTFVTALKAFGCEKNKENEIIKQWEMINNEVLQKNQSKTPLEIKELLIDTLNKTDPEKISKSQLDEVFKQKKPWNEVKRHGINGLPLGNIRKTFKLLDNNLKDIGIFLIPVGEIENFSPETGLHGPKFVSKFLKERDLSDPELSQLRDFVSNVHHSKIVIANTSTLNSENTGCSLGENHEMQIEN